MSDVQELSDFSDNEMDLDEILEHVRKIVREEMAYGYKEDKAAYEKRLAERE